MVGREAKDVYRYYSMIRIAKRAELCSMTRVMDRDKTDQEERHFKLNLLFSVTGIHCSPYIVHVHRYLV